MADLVIRGMKMPRDCPMCILAHFNKLDEFTGCDAVPGKRYVPHSDGQFWNSSERPSWCPLLPLPAGHGRLIDADALIKNHFSDEHRIALSYANKLWMRRIINGEPTIVPAEGGTDECSEN